MYVQRQLYSHDIYRSANHDAYQKFAVALFNLFNELYNK